METTHNESTSRPRIFFSVGEPSGDVHGANLIAHLNKTAPNGIEAVGYGGPKMQQAGCDLHEDLTKFAVMWFARALLNIHHFYGLLSRAKKFFRNNKVDAVVLIDYPGFNWHIAKAAKKQGIPVFYYSPPQVWAWARWRVKKMRNLIDHVLSGLPFETEWFRKRGINATFVGHPFFDETILHVMDAEFSDQQRKLNDDKKLITILPGSRSQEVKSNFPDFLNAAAKVYEQFPDVRFVVASFKPSQAAMAEKMIQEKFEAGHTFPITVCSGKTPELIAAADVCIATSGSVSLQLLYYQKPTVIHYRISRLAFWVQGFFRKSRFITLVNMLSSEEPLREDFDAREEYTPESLAAEGVCFPEYLTCRDRSDDLVHHVLEWLNEPQKREALESRLAELSAELAQGSSSQRATDYILEVISQSQEKV